MGSISGKAGAEVITATEYLYDITAPSKFLRGKIVDVGRGLHCPRCERDLGRIEHGETRKCGCGLNVTLYGNALEIWE